MIEVTHYHRPDALGVTGPAHSPDYAKDALTCEVWAFNLDTKYGGEITLRLVGYRIMNRQTKRHRFRADKHWSTYDKRSNTVADAAVPCPYSVQREAVAQVKFRFEAWAGLTGVEVGPLGGAIVA